jgi:hypothetical protein
VRMRAVVVDERVGRVALVLNCTRVGPVLFSVCCRDRCGDYNIQGSILTQTDGQTDRLARGSRPRVLPVYEMHQIFAIIWQEGKRGLPHRR